jgi:hypothetical protein
LGCPYLVNKSVEGDAGALALAFDEVVFASLLGGGWVVVALTYLGQMKNRKLFI